MYNYKKLLKESKLWIVMSEKNMRKGIYNFFDEIVKKYPEKEILVVTHAGISIYAKCYFEGEPKDGNYNKYKLKNCEILQYENI